MRLGKLLGTIALSTMAMLAVASTASAADEPAKGGQRLAVPFTQRGITVGAMILAPDLDFSVTHLGSLSTPVSTAIGARFGIIDDLEVNAVAIPLTYSPDFRYGNPRVGAIFRFLKGDFELGAGVNTRIPTKSGDQFGLQAGLPARLHIGKPMALDTGAFFLMNGGAGEDYAGAIAASVSSALGALGGTVSRDNTFGISIPIVFNFDVADPVHVGATTGFSIGDFGHAGDSIGIPLGFQGGFALAGDKGPMLDVDPYFLFPLFATPGSSGDKINAKIFTVGAVATFYLYL